MNVLSPLRYPGGKTKLYNKVNYIITNNKLNSTIYVEPFAGGCGLALKLLFNNNVKELILNDMDYCIYAVWFCILNQTQELIDLIINTEITLENWYKQKEIYKNPENHSILEVGFATMFLNRTNRSGVLKAGPIGGYKQNGDYLLDCRFNKDAIIKKIIDISNYRNLIHLYNLDAIDLINNVINISTTPLFINFDPPYYNKGCELYTNYYKPENHIKLKNSISTVKQPWITTYDDCDFISKLYDDYKQEKISLTYSAGQNKSGQELMIYSNNLNI